MRLGAAARGTGRELWWWFSRISCLLRRRPVHGVVALVTLWLFGSTVLPWVVGFALLIVTIRLWALRSPLAFERISAGPARRLLWRIRMRRIWPEVAAACGLACTKRALTPGRHEPRPVLPRLLRVSAEGPRVTLHLSPLMGQTVETFAAAGEQLRMAVGASRVRVDPEGVNRVLVTFTIGDPLAMPFPAKRPLPSECRVDSVLMGWREDGSQWRLPVGPHTLVAGVSGAGKGSVFWSFAFGLAPAVRLGTVQLHGVDLKGGMEVLMGADLFTTRATNAGEAVVLLERLVDQMRARTRTYAGRVRAHVASTEEPLHVVMIDELAAITAYCPERDLQRRAEMAINLLCSQGRAPGFVVFACLQDPRKEVIPSRGLFTQMVGLRLKDAVETSMVLGEAAVASGAVCHRITRSVPGTGYVVPEDGGYPVRVRAGFVLDDQIRSVSAEYATPDQETLPLPQSIETLPRLRSRQGTGVA